MAHSVTPAQTSSDIDLDIKPRYSDTLSYQFYPEVLMFLFKIRGPKDFKLSRFNCCQAFS